MSDALIPDAAQVRFEQRCLDHFDARARELEQKLAFYKEQLIECQNHLVEVETTAKTSNLLANQLLQSALNEIILLKQERRKMEQSTKTQIKLFKAEIIRRIKKSLRL
jgi:hypothetical protein